MRVLTGVLIGCVALLNACKEHKNEESMIHVTNGAAIGNDEYPAVVRISLGGSSCTASFLSDDVLLTAAHCVRNKTFPKDVKVLVHPLYTASTGANRTDLALIKFSEKKSDYHVEISSRPPKAKEQITIVGFGLSDAEDKTTSGVKRMGRNVLDSRENGLLVFSGVVRGSAKDGAESASASGDSGGPMFLEGKQVGVTSAGAVKGNTKFSIYVDLHSKDSKDFFRQANDAGFDIPLPAGY